MSVAKNIRNIWLTAMGLIVMMFMMASVSYAADDPIKFLDEKGQEQTVTDYTLVKNMPDKSGVKMYGGSSAEDASWYVLSEDKTYEYRIHVEGAVNLILCDNVELTPTRGIHVPQGSSLRIYGQSTGADMGRIYANSKEYSRDSALGGDEDETNGDIIINGGEVTVRSGDYASGIGGGDEGHTGNITINGGKVDAQGGYEGAGIGGGDKGGGGNIIINGGYVEATGGESASGIGAGDEASGGKVTINGGNVKAYSGHYSYGPYGSKYTGAGIGGGRFGHAGEITITGGKVVAIGRHGSAGIGNGSGNNSKNDGAAYSGKCQGGKITITGGNVTGDANFNRQNENGVLNDGGAAIGSGFESYGVEVIITGGSIMAFGSYYSSTKDSEGWTVGRDAGACIGNGYHAKSKGSVTITGDENNKTYIHATRPYAYVANGYTMNAIGTSPDCGECDVTFDYPNSRVELPKENNDWGNPVSAADRLKTIKGSVILRILYCEHDQSDYVKAADGHYIDCPYCGTHEKQAHVYDGYSWDNSFHWKACTVCGDQSDKASHRYDQSTGKCACGSVLNTPEYTVTFEDGLGNVLKTEKVEKGRAATAPEEPSREGYTFNGWDTFFKVVASNLTVRAQWKENTPEYLVTFDDGQGNILKTETVLKGRTAAAPEDPVKEGYVFAGWDKAFDNITADTYVTATWLKDKVARDEDKYTVVFVFGFGNDPERQIVEKGQDAIAPETIPEVDGFTFTGWDKAYTNINANTTVTAQWKKITPAKEFTVVFVDGYSVNPLLTQRVKEAASATPPADPTRNGYTFTGWDTDFSYVTSNLTVIAQWKQNGEPSDPSQQDPDQGHKEPGETSDETVSLNKAEVTLADEPLVYSGEALKPEIKAIAGLTLREGTDYTVSFANEAGAIDAPVDAGDYTMTITGMGKYSGTATVSFTIAKAGNSLSVKGKTVKIKAKKAGKAKAVKKVKKTKKLAVKKTMTITGAQGDLTFEKANKVGKKKIKVNARTGKITVRKGLKKGTYKVKVRVTAAGDQNYGQGAQIATVKIKVR